MYPSSAFFPAPEEFRSKILSILESSSTMVNFQELLSTQVSSAAISSCASAFITLAIVKSDGGLTSPYRRIIFSLSVSDLLQSLALFTGPFAVTSGLWSRGNDLTCRVNGVIYTIGSCSTSMYTLALCTYSVMKIKKRTMTDQNFTRNMERFIHPTILLFTMSLSIAGLVTRTINGTSLGNICTFAAVPA